MRTTHQTEERQRLELESWQAGLDALHARIAHRFRRAEVRERAKRYLAGLLGRVERKKGWQLAEYLGEAGPHGVQRLRNKARWNADEVRDDRRASVTEQVGAPDGVLIVDETSFPKEGTKSVGVKPPQCGRTGEIENCQVGVFLAYASARGSAFLDRELFLPEDEVRDQERRTEAGVPDEVVFAKKADLARVMLERACAARVPAAWVTGDAQYGEDTKLRRWLERHERSQVLAVKSFQDAKGVVGLDQYEVRKWDAWQRHITLALLAHAYLEVIRCHAAEKKDGKRGEQQKAVSPGRCQRCDDCCWLWSIHRSVSPFVWTGPAFVVAIKPQHTNPARLVARHLGPRLDPPPPPRHLALPASLSLMTNGSAWLRSCHRRTLASDGHRSIIGRCWRACCGS